MLRNSASRGHKWAAFFWTTQQPPCAATPEVSVGSGLQHSTWPVATVIFQSQGKASLWQLERSGREKVFLLLGKGTVESQSRISLSLHSHITKSINTVLKQTAQWDFLESILCDCTVTYCNTSAQVAVKWCTVAIKVANRSLFCSIAQGKKSEDTWQRSWWQKISTSSMQTTNIGFKWQGWPRWPKTGWNPCIKKNKISW